MKKIIKILSQLSLVSLGTLSTVACGKLIGGGVLEPGKPADPEVKDENYYQALINENEANIKDCQEWINDIEDEYNKGEVDKDDYQLAKTEINAEINHYQAENAEYHYQILLIHDNGAITIVNKAQAIIYLTNKIDNLSEELKVKTKIIKDYPDEYLQEDLDEISSNIINSQLTLNNLLKIEEEK